MVKQTNKTQPEAASRFELNHRSGFSGMVNFAEHIKRLFGSPTFTVLWLLTLLDLYNGSKGQN